MSMPRALVDLALTRWHHCSLADSDAPSCSAKARPTPENRCTNLTDQQGCPACSHFSLTLSEFSTLL